MYAHSHDPDPAAATADSAHRSPLTSGPGGRPRRTGGGRAWAIGSQGAVGGIAQGHHVGADPVLGNAEDPAARLLVADGRVPAADPEVGGGQHHRHGRLAQVVLVDRAGSAPPPARRRTSTTVAAAPATWRAPRHTVDSSWSCARSVTTTKSHFWRLDADGDRQPASRMRSRSPGWMGRSRRRCGRCAGPGWRPMSPYAGTYRRPSTGGVQGSPGCSARAAWSALAAELFDLLQPLQVSMRAPSEMAEPVFHGRHQAEPCLRRRTEAPSPGTPRACPPTRTALISAGSLWSHRRRLCESSEGSWMPITLSRSRLAASVVPGAAVKTMMRRSLPVTVRTSQSSVISSSAGWATVLRADEGALASKRSQREPNAVLSARRRSMSVLSSRSSGYLIDASRRSATSSRGGLPVRPCCDGPVNRCLRSGAR